MDLGAFSVSLTVKDLAVSRDFYERLGFAPLAGDAAQGWLVLKNGAAVVGLFQGMFERNVLTFNPGWDSSAQPVESFTDIRDLQRALTDAGFTPSPAVDESTSGPGYLMLIDPDGNPIIIDQHV